MQTLTYVVYAIRIRCSVDFVNLVQLLAPQPQCEVRIANDESRN